MWLHLSNLLLTPRITKFFKFFFRQVQPWPSIWDPPCKIDFDAEHPERWRRDATACAQLEIRFHQSACPIFFLPHFSSRPFSGKYLLKYAFLHFVTEMHHVIAYCIAVSSRLWKKVTSRQKSENFQSLLRRGFVAWWKILYDTQYLDYNTINYETLI